MNFNISMVFSIIRCLFFYVALISQLCNSQHCTTQKSNFCIFPFEYQNKTYSGCSVEKVKPGRSWCSIRVDESGKHVKGKRGITWDLCSSDCPVDTDPDTKCKETSQCLKTDDCPQFQKFKNIPKINRPPGYQTQRKKWKDSICNKKKRKLCCPKKLQGFRILEPPVNICNETQEYSGAYLPTLGQCGKLCSAGRIFGGVNAKLGEFPWAVLIGYKVRKRRKTWPEQKWVRYWADEYRCGGTLINTRYVLTAAHCNGGLSKIKSVVLGEWQVGVDPDCPYGNKDPKSCKPKAQVIEVESIVIHEDYRDNKINGAGVVNDIALLRLKNHANLNEAVQPICLPLNQEEASEEIGADNFVEGIIGREATVVGWGTTRNWQRTNNITGVAQDILQKVDLTLITNEYCQSQLEDLPGDLIIQETHFCAGNHTKKDSCKGDSGGGMFINKKLGEKTDDTSYQIGIVSFGLSKCGIGYPAVYTRISEFIPWIKENIHD